MTCGKGYYENILKNKVFLVLFNSLGARVRGLVVWGD
jgi:hypothetical protein